MKGGKLDKNCGDTPGARDGGIIGVEIRLLEIQSMTMISLTG